MFALALVAVFVIGYAIAYRDTNEREKNLHSKEKNLQEKHENQQTEFFLEKDKAEKEIDAQKEDLENFYQAWKQEYDRLIKKSEELNNAFKNGYIKGSEWLAKAYNEYILTRDLKLEF